MSKVLMQSLAGRGNFDIAAGVHESLLTGFSAAHHKLEHPKAANVYKGMGEVKDLRLAFRYDIAKPANFDLTPIAGFEKALSRWLIRQPEILSLRGSKSVRDLLSTVQPHLKLNIPQIDLTLVLQTIGKEISLSFSFTVLALVTTDQNNLLHITPIEAHLDDPARLDRDIATALRKDSIDPGHQDPSCYELAELTKYVVNSALADRIAQFATAITLPSFITVVGDTGLGNVTLTVEENFIVATGVVKSTVLSADLGQLMANSESIKGAASLARAMAESAHQRVTEKATKAFIRPKSAMPKALPGNGFFILLAQQFFQTLAEKFIRIDDRNESCSTLLGFIEACVGWFVRLGNPKTSISGNELLVNFDFEGGAYAKARAKTHCGPTPWVSVGIGAKANPAKIVTSFFVRNGRELGMSAGPRPFLIDWSVEGLPFPIDRIIGWILDLLSDVAILIASIIGVRWTRTLVNIPDTLPGTEIPATPVIDSQIINFQGAIAVTGKVTFK